MTLFIYHGRNTEGPVQGEMKADSLNSAIESLRAQQVEIYDIRPADWRESLYRHRIFLMVVALVAVSSIWIVRWTQRQQMTNTVHMALAWAVCDDGLLVGLDPTTHETVLSRHLDSGVTPIAMKVNHNQHSLVILDGKHPRLVVVDLNHLDAPTRDIALSSPATRLIQMPNGDLCCLHPKPGGFTVFDGNDLTIKGYRGMLREPGDLAVTPDGHYWIVSQPGLDQLSIINTVSGRQVATFPCGSEPGLLALQPDGHDLWVLGRDGNLRRVTFDWSGHIPTVTTTTDGVSTLGGHDPVAMIAPFDDRCYVLNQDDGVIGVISATDQSLIRMIPTAGSSPCGWAQTSTQKLWIADKEGQCLGIVDMSTDQSEGHVQLKSDPVAVEISSSGMSP